MKLDRRIIRSLGRIADRTAVISKNPHRYEVDAEMLDHIVVAAEQFELLLTKVETIKVGARTIPAFESPPR